MVEEDTNKLLKTLNKNMDGLKDMFKSLKKGDNVDDIKKTIDGLESDIGEFKKTLSDKDDIIKGLEGDKTKLEDENKDMKKNISDAKEVADKKAHKDLITKALGLVKELDDKTEIKDEDSYVKSLSKSFTEDELKEDADSCIKTDVKAMELAKTHISVGDLPNNDGSDSDETLDDDAKRAAELRKTLGEKGLLQNTAGDE